MENKTPQSETIEIGTVVQPTTNKNVFWVGEAEDAVLCSNKKELSAALTKFFDEEVKAAVKRFFPPTAKAAKNKAENPVV